ncbi:MAG TPA: GNAT family N-acetyltransferase [Thermoanaerobaculia bacterium]|nr:GNAT family N-acetyltransferase [Thermoanaerobaculia bacterium]
MNHKALNVTHNEAAKQFEVTVDGHVALAAYDMEDGRIVFTHTEVPPELSGRGIANQLAKSALEYARAEKLTVVPQCAFIASWIKRHDEYADLLA